MSASSSGGRYTAVNETPLQICQCFKILPITKLHMDIDSPENRVFRVAPLAQCRVTLAPFHARDASHHLPCSAKMTNSMEFINFFRMIFFLIHNFGHLHVLEMQSCQAEIGDCLLLRDGAVSKLTDLE